MASGRSARYRAKLKHKKQKERARKSGMMTVKRAGGRLKVSKSKEYKARFHVR